MIRRYGALAATALALMTHQARADILAISPIGAAGPGGTVTFSEIGPLDLNSANVNTDFTAMGILPITAAVSDSSPIAIYGNDVNDTAATWGGFEATITAGTATFQDPNNPVDPYGTYTDTLGWSVSILDGGRTALFSGGLIAPGDSLDTFLGLVVADPSQPVTVALSPLSVPEPSALVMASIGLAILGGARAARRMRPSRLGAILAAALALAPAVGRAGGPQVVAAYQPNFTLQSAGVVPGSPTQMVFGPSGLLYVATTDVGVVSLVYDPTTGALSSPVNAAPSVQGIGVAFHGANMYLTSNDGTLHKLDDANGNGIWGEAGELDVAIVTGIPTGDHSIDQLQITGNTLYVGIGLRTINGHRGAWTSGALDDYGGVGFFGGGLGRTWGDSSYNGTIAWIQDLTKVVDATGSANAWTTEPPVLTQALIQGDAGPFTTKGLGKLVVHSAGTRNPFGLCLDGGNNLWFTCNFNRTATLGNGQAGFGLRGDQLDSDFSRDVQDQLFQASPGADYGYTTVNWRGINPMLNPKAPGYHRVKSTTFDNLFNKGPYTLHDPANPDGLGPSSSPDGCAFFSSPLLPAALQGNIFIARFNGTITEAPGGPGRSLTYSDLVSVDVAAGKVRRIASGFNSPLAVLADDAAGRLLVADYGDHVIYALQAVTPPAHGQARPGAPLRPGASFQSGFLSRPRVPSRSE